VERHALYVSLAPRMDHPRGVEPPPRNVQRCYAHVNVEKGDRAPSTRTSTSSKNTEKHLATLEHSKKRSRSSETTEVPENPTSKRRRIIQNLSDEEEEENLTADLLNPCRRKDVEWTVQEGPSRPAAAPARGALTASTAATSHGSPPSDGGQGSSGQQGSQGRPRRRAFSAADHQADM
jgi:hypothetical protein